MNDARFSGPAAGRAVRTLWWIVALGAVLLLGLGWKAYRAWGNYESFVPGEAEARLLPGHAQLVECATGLSVRTPDAAGAVDEFGLRWGHSSNRAGGAEPAAWMVAFGRALRGKGDAEQPSWVCGVRVGTADLVLEKDGAERWATGLERVAEPDPELAGAGVVLERLRRDGREIGFHVSVAVDVSDPATGTPAAAAARRWTLAVVGAPLSDPAPLRALVDSIRPTLRSYVPR